MRRRLVVLLAVMATGLATGSGAAFSAPASPSDAGKAGQGHFQEVEPRIVGGEPVPDGKYRYIAAVRKKAKPLRGYCGGTLIDRDSVLTAAHCFPGPLKNRPGNFRVFLGRTDMTSNKGVVRDIKRIFVHPRYNGSRDAAVLKLSRPVRNIPKLKLAPVSSGNRLEKPGSSAMIAGWGHTVKKSFTHPNCIPDPYNAPTPERMREARVPILRDSYAAHVYNTFLPSHGYNCGRYVPRTMIAADKNGKGTCQGDSGGPLIKIAKRNGKKVHIQISIVSFGAGCAYNGYPGVYAEVNSKQIAPFIKSAASK